MTVLETDRLLLRRLRLDDAEVMLRLLNDPAFLQFIGDRGVRTLDQARRYIADGPIASYQRHGFGMYLATRKTDSVENGVANGVAIGLCGLVKRETLEDVDLGYALLPEFRAQGYAFEAASAVVDFARRVIELERLVAVVQDDNAPSIRVLERLGLRYERRVRASEDDVELALYSMPFGPMPLGPCESSSSAIACAKASAGMP